MDELTASASHVFTYPASSEDRRHGPTGYRDPSSYKPWLRDEFTFRCIYCLTREVWRPDGHDSFSIEHVAARSTNPESIGEYDNLVYACVACNSRRQHLPLPFHPSEENLASHLRVNQHGRVESLSESGERLIELCRLNRSTLVRFRQRVLHLIGILSKSDHPDATDALGQLLAWPEDMPDLGALRPPGGNERAVGVSDSFLERKRRDELPRYC